MVRIRSPLADVVSNVAGYFILSCQSYVSNGLETTTYDFGLASLESTAESRKSPDRFLPCWSFSLVRKVLHLIK